MKRPSLRILALTSIALSVLAWTGCGGDSARTLPTSSMSNAQFVNQVEAICAHGRSRGLRFQPPAEGQSERDALTRAIDSTLLPSLQGVIDEIYALGAPSSEQAQTEALLVALQDAVDAAEGLDAPTLESVEGLLERPGALARKAGLRSCMYG